MIAENIIKDLNKLGDRIIALIKELMLRRNKNATGRTLKSLRQATEIDTSFVYELDVYGSIVFQYINDGRQPNSKLPPKGSLLEWMKVRGIPQAAEYAVRKSIAIKGITPYPIIDLTVVQVQKQLLGKASEEVLETVSDTLTKAFREGFNFPVIQLL